MSQIGKRVKSTASVSLIVFASKAFGFAREAIMAAYFGTGVAADAYAAAYGTYYVPILLFGSCISSALIPMYVKSRERDGLEKANALASNAMTLFALAGAVIMVLMYLFAGPILHALYPGFSVEAHEASVVLIRVMLPMLVFALIAQVQLNILNAQEHHIAAQLNGFPLSVCSILAAVLFSAPFGIMAMGVAVALSAFLQVVIQMPVLMKTFHYRPALAPRDKQIRQMMKLAIPGLLTMSATEINNIIDKSMASAITSGALSAINYAFRLVVFVNGVLVIPLMTISYTQMSERAAKDDKEGIVTMFRESAELLTAGLLPVTLIAAILSHGVIRLVYMRGAFDETSLQLTSGVFAMYILGELFFGLRDILNRVFHSMQNTRTPMRIALVMIVLNVILNVVLIKLMGLNGLPLATTVSGILSVIMLLAVLRRRVGPLHIRDSIGEFLRIGAATVVAATVCLVLRALIPEPEGVAALLGYLALIGGGSMAVYLLTALLLGSRNIRSLPAAILRRRR